MTFMLVPGIFFQKLILQNEKVLRSGQTNVTAGRYKSIIVQSGGTRATVWDSVIHLHLVI